MLAASFDNEGFSRSFCDIMRMVKDCQFISKKELIVYLEEIIHGIGSSNLVEIGDQGTVKCIKKILKEFKMTNSPVN